MAINGITSISICTFGSANDAEAKKIAERLRMYGITPTGDKSVDRAKLREIELREAEKESSVSNKFITVSRGEQEKIQTKKKEKQKETNPESFPNSENAEKLQKAQKAPGEQIYLAINMKNKKDKKDSNSQSNG